MSDLISREALKKAITANHYLLSAKNNSVDYGMFTTGIMQAIDNATTVEPERPAGDLISREALKKACSEMVRGSNNSDFIPCPTWNNAMELIDNAPTVPQTQITVFTENGNKEELEQELQRVLDDLRPKGEWIRTGSLGNKNGNAQYECSNCHYGDERAESQEVPYCWHCGAKLEKPQTQKFADNDTAYGGLASAT